ncbi:hypothetical protein SAMN04488044_0312 [Cognatishimia maritima]|uniref:Uncharacterized protein n=1 Tax=Cognatishimia maritima TaxID=870908 RepID=A0A1M5IFK0_9RHOB|nr:hypothetical protein SAMN04488044_0312 [Cognatishimia maritima]
MTLTQSWFTLFIPKRTSKDLNEISASDCTPREESLEASNEERAFLRDLICEHSEAVQSELGVMALMSQYPSRF